MQEGDADLDRCHAAFAGEEPSQRNFELAVGEEEDRLAVQDLGSLGDRLAGAGAGRFGHLVEKLLRDAEFRGDGAQPGGRALFAEGEGRGDVPGTATLERGMGVGQEGLGQGEDGIFTDTVGFVDIGGRKHANRSDPHRFEQTDGLLFHHIGQCADQEQAHARTFAAAPAPSRRGRHLRPA